MNQRELDGMTIDELGRKYWKLVKLAKTHPQRDMRGSAGTTSRVVLEEFQRRLIAGETACIDDYQ